MGRPSVSMDFLHDISVDVRKTNPVQVPQWARTAAVYIPNLNADGVVSMEVMEYRNVTAAKLVADQDTDWITVRDEGESSQIAASGVDTCWMDISEFIKGLPKDCFIRFVCGADQVGDLTWVITFGG